MRIITLHRSKCSHSLLPDDLERYSSSLREQLEATSFPYQAHQAGQDRVIRSSGWGGHPQNQLLMVLDGHGPNGHHVSYVGGQLLLQNLARVTPILLRHLESEHPDRVASLLTWAYRQTENQMYQTDSRRNRIFSQVTGNSGSTVAVAMLLHVSGKRFLVCSNAGDSLIHLYRPSKGVTTCSREYNGDCQEAVTDYLQHLEKVKHQLQKESEGASPELQRRYRWRLEALRPKPIYWNRINTATPGSITVPQITNSRGQPTPLTVWKYTQAKDGTPLATLDTASYRRISDFYPVGGQSRKVPPTRVLPDGRTVAVEGHEADNFGSTLAGRLQVIRGLGDEYEGEHCTCEPYVSIQTVEGPATLLVASDGFTDLEHTLPMMTQLHHQRTDPDPESGLANYLEGISRQDTSGQYTVYRIPGDTKWYPIWDDLSGHVVYLS